MRQVFLDHIHDLSFIQLCDLLKVHAQYSHVYCLIVKTAVGEIHSLIQLARHVDDFSPL